MHQIEPFFQWRGYYKAEDDMRSPFFQRQYSELYFTNQIYDHLIHPQWDEIGSPTLYAKLLYADYEQGYAILEFLGEWNDCIYQDIMYLKREIADTLIGQGINRFILIGEHILNFHADGDDYYEEWYQDVEEGWIALLNFREHVLAEITDANLDYYLISGGELNDLPWRTLDPPVLFGRVSQIIGHRLG